MIDLKVFEPYIVDSAFNIELSARQVKIIGLDEYFNIHVKKWCDCSVVTPEGQRLLQTNELRYKIEITTTLYLINEFGGDKKDYYYGELLKIHNSNLEFERINGFAYDIHLIKTKEKSTTPKKRTKQTSLEIGDKPKKETAAERKLKAHIAKINSFNFVIKPVSNGN